MTQSINRGIDNYLDSLVAYCAQNQNNQFAEDVRDYFFQVFLETLISKLTEEQFNQIEHLDPSGVEMANKLQQLASQIPGFAQEVVARLKKEALYIKQYSKLPE